MVISVPAQWTAVAHSAKSKPGSSARDKYFTLDLAKLQQQVNAARHASEGRNAFANVTLPGRDGNFEVFRVKYDPVAVASLAERYQLQSYSGTSVRNPFRTVYFSLSPFGFSGMIYENGKYQFLERADQESPVYALHDKTGKQRQGAALFLCSTPESPAMLKEIADLYSAQHSARMATDQKVRTLRLAISTTAEYTQYFGGVPQALAAVNATLTRVNGIFQRDFGVKLILQDFPQLIYTDASTDPYSDYTSGANGNWSVELQNTLTSMIGNASYDLGHLFGANGGGGNAGAVGLVCKDDTSSTMDINKGAAFTSPADGKPVGDNFDIDFVAHEMAHQIGATHTFSHVMEDGSAQVEPGSGSTIMGYAGITTADVQKHSDSYFHAVTIAQVQAKLNQTSCDLENAVANRPPLLAVPKSYIIPKSTAFVLTGQATDPEGDLMSFTWEQADVATKAVTRLTGNETTGPIFRSLPPTEVPVRYFPNLQRVLEGSLNNPADWEVVPNVPRTLNFLFTARDNYPIKDEQQTASAPLTITVGENGPFRINSAEIYLNAPTTVIWDPAGTDAAPYSAANVKIDYSADGGSTWNTLAASTPNDGSEAFTIPNQTVSSEVILRISALENVFYAVAKTRTATAQTCDGAAPASLSVRFIANNSAQLNWNMISGASYLVRYRMMGTHSWTEKTVNQNVLTLSSLQEGTVYEFQVAGICSGAVGSFSSVNRFATRSAVIYCPVSTESAVNEYISNVSLANVANTSAASTYTDYSADADKLVLLTPAATYRLTVGITAKDVAGTEMVKAWIDFNRNGIFEDSEVIMKTGTASAVKTASFTIPADALPGRVTKMRVALRYTVEPADACTSYEYGEVEDYAVAITNDSSTAGADVHLFPNPANDYIAVTNVSEGTPYKIYDASGRLLQTGAVSRTIRVGSLAPGVYILSLKGDQKQFKFIKK